MIRRIETTDAKVLLGACSRAQWGKRVQRPSLISNLSRSDANLRRAAYPFFSKVRNEAGAQSPDGLHPNERGVADAGRSDRAGRRPSRRGASWSAQVAAAAADGEPETSPPQLHRRPLRRDGATLGILYTTEPAAAALPELVPLFAEHNGNSFLGRRRGASGCVRRPARSSNNPRRVIDRRLLREDIYRSSPKGHDPDQFPFCPRRPSAVIDGVQPVFCWRLSCIRAALTCRGREGCGVCERCLCVGRPPSHPLAPVRFLAMTAGEDVGGS